MDDTLTRFVNDLVGRLTGPMTFRLILQPVMASVMAWRDGVRDAHEGRPPYFWTMFTKPGGARGQLLLDGVRAVGRVIVLGIVMEVIYQFIVFRWVYPGELIVVVFILAFVPYIIVRGAANRLVRRGLRREGGRP
jgi:hypothetical protein